MGMPIQCFAAAGAACVLVLGVVSASAQPTCGVRTHARALAVLSESTGPIDGRADSDWVAQAPSSVTAAAGGTGPLASASATYTPTADYGVLSAVGSASGTGIVGGATFIGLSSWIGGFPQAQFRDELLIQSASLPAGAPVELRVTVTLAGGVVAGLGSAPSANFVLAEAVVGGVQVTRSEPGTATGVIGTAVGQRVILTGSLRAEAAGTASNTSSASSNCSVNVNARFSIDVLTPGASYSACSGRRYGCSADFDGDGDTGTDGDIEAFFRCLAGDCCATCGTADFDGDGDTGTDGDIETFFRTLAGQPC